jgi:hypothetical protein
MRRAIVVAGAVGLLLTLGGASNCGGGAHPQSPHKKWGFVGTVVDRRPDPHGWENGDWELDINPNGKSDIRKVFVTKGEYDACGRGEEFPTCLPD